ncbi:cell surface glycoprotein CD200 receptor 1-B-like [Empidonax traillii]|uniref:cell surface glycoprotein CD200 receptor 1-B-like n=1 Tax=Empidonax traillii TaxID=164674 RepID=UPI000FFD05DB|nr:cell surface glycoprotein CD200 receptor 1-B-like [Empidonax traillii]
MAQKWAVLAVLLFLPINLVEASNMVSVEAGHEAVLSCPYTFKEPLVMVTWKKKCSSCCVLAYRSDYNETGKINCSERIMWKYPPDSDPALRIYPVYLGDEGNYSCEIINSEGNFYFSSSLTVIVPPRATLSYDEGRGAVCQASGGKPAADISWIPASNPSTEEEIHHPDGTVTRVSYTGWGNSTQPTATCLVTHPATNQTLSIDLTNASPSLPYLLIGGSASVAAVTGVTLCLICGCRAFRSRQLAQGPAEPSATRNSKSTPSHVLADTLYENYIPGSIYMNL